MCCRAREKTHIVFSTLTHISQKFTKSPYRQHRSSRYWNPIRDYCILLHGNWQGYNVSFLKHRLRFLICWTNFHFNWYSGHRNRSRFLNRELSKSIGDLSPLCFFLFRNRVFWGSCAPLPMSSWKASRSVMPLGSLDLGFPRGKFSQTFIVCKTPPMFPFKAPFSHCFCCSGFSHTDSKLHCSVLHF